MYPIDVLTHLKYLPPSIDEDNKMFSPTKTKFKTKNYSDQNMSIIYLS